MHPPVEHDTMQHVGDMMQRLRNQGTTQRNTQRELEAPADRRLASRRQFGTMPA
jgi:hypothetical protein